MIKDNCSECRLTPSQQYIFNKIYPVLSTTTNIMHRPNLLTGDLGVGKSFLSKRLAENSASYINISRDHLSILLRDYRLSDLTPEVIVRYVRALVDKDIGNYVIIDGLEPLLSMWMVDHPNLLSNLFIPLSRIVVSHPSVVVITTSKTHLSYQMIKKKDWWPIETHYHLELTLRDKEIVAENWGIDPVRSHISANLYDLLATKLMG